MPDTKITALTAIGANPIIPSTFPIPMVDLTDTSMAASGTTKKVTVNQILGAGGTATLASATITGDLTVATSALKVVSASNRVLINQAAAIQGDSLEISAKSDGGTISLFGRASDNGATLAFRANGATTAKASLTANDNGLSIRTGTVERYNIDTTGVSTWSVGGSTAMTLNATGLGVGVVPAALSGFGSTFRQKGVGSAGGIFTENNTASSWFGIYSGTSLADSAALIYPSGGTLRIATTTGVGVGGFSTQMTLDASGNLLLGKTVNSITTVGFQSTSTGEVSAALAASTNAATQWTTYSTGAAAYRFYVGMGGTVFATNTTISAISDARLKENVQDLDVGLNEVLALKPRKFDWKAGKGKDIKGDRGFIAQEFETVFPNLIDEWKDNAPEGEAPYKSVRQDLIPVLVKAIQELAARVQTLEAK